MKVDVNDAHKERIIRLYEDKEKLNKEIDALKSQLQKTNVVDNKPDSIIDLFIKLNDRINDEWFNCDDCPRCISPAFRRDCWYEHGEDCNECIECQHFQDELSDFGDKIFEYKELINKG